VEEGGRKGSQRCWRDRGAVKCNSRFSVPSMLQFGLWWTNRDGWCSIWVRVHGKIPGSRSSSLCRAHAELISVGGEGVVSVCSEGGRVKPPGGLLTDRLTTTLPHLS
jgi:hypothetical protein